MIIGVADTISTKIEASTTKIRETLKVMSMRLDWVESQENAIHNLSTHYMNEMERKIPGFQPQDDISFESKTL